MGSISPKILKCPMMVGQVVPIPHIVFVIAFIQTKQRKQNENQQALCRTPSQDALSCELQGMLCQVCGDTLSVEMHKYTHYNWLLLSVTSLFISYSINNPLSF